MDGQHLVTPLDSLLSTPKRLYSVHCTLYVLRTTQSTYTVVGIVDFKLLIHLIKAVFHGKKQGTEKNTFLLKPRSAGVLFLNSNAL